MTPLFDELRPVIASVACSGQQHRIRWSAGELEALDHEDPDGERALTALGGPSCACLDVLDAWTRQQSSTRPLAALSRGIRDPVQPQEIGVGPGFRGQHGALLRAGARGPTRLPRPGSGWVSTSAPQTTTYGSIPGLGGPQKGDQESDVSDLGILANLGYPMTLRLVATVTTALLNQEGSAASSSVQPSVQPALRASLFGRSWSALRDWLGVPDLQMELVVADPSEEPTVELGTSDPLRVFLPLDWVVSVWGRDLTVVAGRFCLGVIESTDTRTTLLSVGADFEAPRRLTVELQ